MISTFNKSQYKLKRQRKAYIVASRNYDAEEVKEKAKNLMQIYPSITRQAAFTKARERFGKTKPETVKVKETWQASIKSLANRYIRNGMSNRQAYRQAYAQLAVN